ncbi:uncharacterized protein PAC_12682 [Phialocephala subalpina]|uniref:Transmembrane protein n=1 Tax=Phialocephala subalpina TaxID=576137 RepID=A0A1L7XCP0_9HELO|nr:uncharacterized protein PAC_12682 [Phialocephala subalpina]
MLLPRFWSSPPPPPTYEPPFGNRYCHLWDRVFHKQKQCPNPAIQTYHPTNAPPGTVAHSTGSGSTNTSDPSGPAGGSIFIVVVLCIVGAGIAICLTTVIHSLVKTHKRKRKFIREREAAAREGRPLPREPARARGWFGRGNGNRNEHGMGAGDMEMGRFRRGLSRARSIAKPNGEVQVHMPPPSRIRPSTNLPGPRPSNQNTTRRPRTDQPPRYSPPQYDNTSRGSPIADQFAEQRMNEEAAGSGERPHTPPPMYAQRMGDRMYEWEDIDDDGTPAPDYVSTSWNPWNQTESRRHAGLGYRRGGRL